MSDKKIDIAENLENIKKRINDAEIKSGRKAGSVKLMAVSKFHPVEQIKQAVDNGQFLFGENRVKEACEKFTELYEYNPQVHLHIIGQLQSNKVKNAVKISECIQSVDRIELVDLIEKNCAAINKQIKILFELHTGEESKSGFASLEEIENVMEMFVEKKYPHIIPAGFMTMAPFTDDKNLVRKSFITLREASLKVKKDFPEYAQSLSELSMGMSGDFEIAIEEGSTLVRVGTAIFGERDYQ